MLRKAFLLLLALPLLMPPGFCLCRLEAFAVRKADRGSDATAANQGTPARPCGAVSARSCRCCHQQTTPPAASADPVKIDQAPDREPASDHAPGCPANPAYAVNRVYSIDSPTQFADFFSGGLVLAWMPLVGLDAQGSSSAAFDVPPPSPRAPLFVLCCNFRC